MKKLALSALLFAAIAFAFTTVGELPIGSDLPKADLKMKDVSGKMISLSEAKKENGLLVMFSCNTCPFVVKNQKRTVEIGSYAMKNKVGVIILNSNENLRGDDDSYDAMRAYAKEQGYRWSYVVDENSQMADLFGATRTPETFLFNKDGKLVYHGAIDNNPGDEDGVSRKHLQLAIDELTGGKDITVKTSKSVGCSIKRKG
jgi:thioredoxin-related protein